MELVKSRISQIHLTKFDEIPLGRLVSSDNLAQLTSLFDLGQASIGHNQEGDISVLCERGSFTSNGAKHPFDKLLVEERKIQLVGMEGTSSEGSGALAQLREFLGEIAGDQSADFLVPVVIAEESEVIAHMEFHYSRIFSDDFLKLVLQDVTEASSSELAAAESKFAQLAFNIDYSISDDSLSDYRVGISRKEFRIEPRKGYPLDDQVFFSKAPLSTELHVQILEALETVLSG